eukprot:TRINITY_DN3395_c0_g1_i1.p1 TRINITY_DN3395_c0_g1~~TRINITY_DN3395_c0_g1_i1.p1  ORF type:complete len:1046 (+),score=237.65 TRINITY_DN3395_c0_g1_i1:70-3138(+)
MPPPREASQRPDWFCQSCGVRNFATQVNCISCRFPRLSVPVPAAVLHSEHTEALASLAPAGAPAPTAPPAAEPAPSKPAAPVPAPTPTPTPAPSAPAPAPAAPAPVQTPAAAPSSAPAPPAPLSGGQKRDVVLLYGSVTGNAESICRTIHGDICSWGFPARVGALNDWDKMKFDQCPGGLLIVISTTGDGEPPENARKFIRFLKKKQKEPQPLYPSLRFSVLALGDQNYSMFCSAGKLCETMLGKLGAKPFYPIGLADDGVGLEIVVEPWRDGLRAALDALSIAPASAAPAAAPPAAAPAPAAPAAAPEAPAAVATPAAPSPALAPQAPVPSPPAAELASHIAQTPPSAPERHAMREKKVVLLYGSQTGNSEAIGRNIRELAQTEGFSVTIAPANQFQEVEWSTYPIFLGVFATTGDGDHCDNARKFWRHLRKRTEPLKHMAFSVLALGDQNYSNFCKAGRDIDARLAELQASRFYDIGNADDGVGLEIVVEPWKQMLLPALQQLCSPLPQGLVTAGDRRSVGRMSEAQSSETPSLFRDVRHGQLNPFFARISGWRLLTADETEPLTYNLTFDVSGFGVDWNPGDAIGVLPCNDEDDVDWILRRLGVAPHDDFPRPTAAQEDLPVFRTARYPLTNRQLLIRHIDMFIRRKDLILYLASHCQGEDKVLLNQWGASTKLFQNYVTHVHLSLREVLALCKTCKPPFVELAERCGCLQPRFYSVASAKEANPNRVDICFAVVKHKGVGGRTVPGVCTTWLQSLLRHGPDAGESPARVGIFLKPTPEFRLPTDLGHPMIMIGPGTGIAPFIGFLQYRRHMMSMQEKEGAVFVQHGTRGTPQLLESSEGEHTFVHISQAGRTATEPQYSHVRASVEDLCSMHRSDSVGDILPSEIPVGGVQVIGEAHLFFGCRNREIDYLYQEDLEDFQKSRVIKYLHVAFSQEEDGAHWYGGVYVQDKMMDVAERLAHLILARNAYIYVCGDAKSMAKDVHRILVDILVDTRRFNAEGARKLLEDLQESGRYQRDIW